MKFVFRTALGAYPALNVLLLALIAAGGMMIVHGSAGSLPSLQASGRGRSGENDASSQLSSASTVRMDPATYRETFPRKGVPPDGLTRGISQAHRLSSRSLSSGWQELGPLYAPRANVANPSTHLRTPVSGRVTALAVDPATCKGATCGIIYVGAASGGVWKSTNAGQTWTPLTDTQQDIAIGSITLDPRDPAIVYVGTGDPDHGLGSHHGIGILRSIDGGQNWTVLGRDQFANRAISSLIVDPRTAGTTNATLYVTTASAQTGGASTGGQDPNSSPDLPPMGFFFSKDGGQTWSGSNPGVSYDGNRGLEAQNLVMDPGNLDRLYAGFDYAGIFTSGDDGRTWSPLTSGLPSAHFSFIRLAISPSDSRVLVAAFDMDSGGNGPEAIFRSTNAGASWTRLRAAPNACDLQCFGNMHVAVDPADPKVFYAGGTANYGYTFHEDASCSRFKPLPTSCSATLMKTTDGGATWADISENGKSGPLHPDNHVILIDPVNSRVIYEGGDGGVFHSADGGRSWNDLNRGLATLQIQGISVGPDGAMYAGTQDNGTFMYTGSTSWKHVNDGDGGITAADPTNVNVSYSTNTGSVLWRNDRRGAPSQNIFIAPFWGDHDKQHRGQFYEPYVLAPSQPQDIFFGTYRIWRSEIRGGVNGPRLDPGGADATDDSGDVVDWVPISFDLSCTSKPTSPAATCDSGSNAGQGVSAVAVSPINPNVVAAATASGQLWITHNALGTVRTDRSCDPRKIADDVSRCNFVNGVTWKRMDTGLPRRFPTALRFGPASSTTLYVTFSGFDENTPGHAGHVFASTDGGKGWQDIDGNGAARLPDLPFNDVIVNPFNGHLYTAADYGVYLSADGGQTWSRISAGLPGVTVYQMQFDVKRRALAVGTYGRGVWEVTAP